MEGATLGLAYGLNRFRQLGIKPNEIRLIGGGSRSGIWRQICADVFRVPVVSLATAEGAALGAALHSAWVDHLVNNKSSSLNELVAKSVKLDEKSRALPAAASADLYQEVFGRFKGLTKGSRPEVTFEGYRLRGSHSFAFPCSFEMCGNDKSGSQLEITCNS